MPKKLLLTLAISLSTGFLLSGCASSANQTTDKSISINYSAAASLKGALTELEKNYEKSHPKININFDFTGSGAIREKVLAGAPIDGVFLASKTDATKLTKAKKAKDETAVLGNTLVLVANKKTPSQTEMDLLTTLTSAHKIAIGQPATVPAGKYAEETMTKLGVFTKLKEKFVMGSDVTQVLSYAASGNVDLGFVYKTDAMSNKNVKVLATIPEKLHSPITYYTETITETKQTKAVQDFNKYLASPAAQKVFEKYGFKSVR